MVKRAKITIIREDSVKQKTKIIISCCVSPVRADEFILQNAKRSV